MKKTKKSYYVSMLFLVFFVPIACSWTLYFYHDYFHFQTTNHGALIQPAIPVPELSLQPNTQHQWQIVYVPNQCGGETYEKTTFILHEMQIALGENYKRVQLAVLTDKSCHLKDLHGFRLISLDVQQMKKLQQELKQASLVSKVYLVDPLGNIMMYYPSEGNAMAILRDIRKLFEVSQIG